ncbi:MAG: hypothetical protein LAQ69_38535 [Acidobacteriia bacterium]|nr:hypothetical protein [Terriglobia bacterium]
MTPRTALSVDRTGRHGVYASAALLCALLGLALECLVVNFGYGGNWTALFCTGSKFPVPPALATERIHVFPNSIGYDGQMYHYVAHDPLVRTDIRRYMDNARARYRRILLPAVAFLLAVGQQARIDSAYIGANLLFLFLGGWWLSRYLDSLSLDPRLAVLFVLSPAALISLDRLTVDLAFTSLCIGFALYVRLKQDANAYAVLALACLCRETGFVLAAAACLALSVERRFRKAAAFATAMIPAAAWYLYVNLRTLDDSNMTFRQLVPFKGIFETLLDPITYPFSGTVDAGLRWLDRWALLGFVLAVLLGVWLARRNGFGQMEAAMMLWSIIGLCLPRSFWEDCYSGARVFTPLLIYVMLRGAPLGRWRVMAPLLMVLPRVALQVLAPLLAAFGLPARP